MLRNIAICSKQNKNSLTNFDYIHRLEMNGFPVFCGLLYSPERKFSNQVEENNYRVLVRKKAFSCNYRDKALIFRIAKQAIESEDIFFAVGSDFVAEVIDIGAKVTELKIGDRVIGNNAYPDADIEGVKPGIPSNHGSKEYQIFHQTKLIKVPPQMSDTEAAAFSIGAQTSYSVVRKFNPSRGANILITAAKSNTSLFVINALKKYGVNIYATTTSELFVEELKAMGVKEVIVVDKKPNSLLENQSIQTIFEATGGFDCVFDPFFDIYLAQSVQLMKFNAKYITCGLYDQYFDLIGKEFTTTDANLSKLIGLVMMKNLQIIGNCLGTREDLQNALEDYVSGNLKVTIDSVFTGKQVGGFLDRTYNAGDRFGKVVYQYS
ncbi:MAG: zinc-binding alcohol dehydrogenase family protein [Cyanobacteria bacterium P01_A01_bin.83]